MLTEEGKQTANDRPGATGATGACSMVGGFIEELLHGCERYNAVERLERYEMCQVTDTSGIVRFKNLYCQYELGDDDNRSLVLSIGWTGPGFHLMAAPDLQFILVRKQWRESSNPMLRFDSPRDLAMFCMNELRHHSECPQSRQPYVQAQTEFTPFH
jgi:hypothetical protein